MADESRSLAEDAVDPRKAAVIAMMTTFAPVIDDEERTNLALWASEYLGYSAQQMVVAAMSDDKPKATPEQAHEVVSGQVNTVLDHLRHNRTTEREASDLHEAARLSLVDHAVAKGTRGA
jgi:hypothetical protein